MRLFVGFAVALAFASFLGFGTLSLAQEQRHAAEGRGLLAQPDNASTALQGSVSNPFVTDPSGGFSRTIFETDDSPDFKIIVRDYSFPADLQTHKITLPSAALFHFFNPTAEVRVANDRLALTPDARIVVPAGSPVDVRTDGTHVATRALILEAK